jgi:cytochrome P450 family 2 subfamily F
MWFIVGLITFLVTLLVYNMIFRKKNFRLPPGPSGWPLVGNAFQLGSSPFIKHDEFSKTFGDMHSVSLFGHKAVVLSSIEAVKDCNLGASDNFNHRPVWLKNLTKSIAPGIAFRGVDNYIDNRRFVLNNLKKRGMGKSELEPTILNEVELMLTYIEENAPLDPKDVLGNYTSNVVAQVCFEKRWDYGDEDYAKFHQAIEKIQVLSEVLGLVDFVPVLGYLPKIKTMSDENYVSVAYIRNFFRKIIETKRKENTDGIFEGSDIVDDYLNTHKEINDEESENLVDICHDLFFAGTDTTSATLGFAVIHLINKPQFQDEFFAQIDKVLKGRDPSLSDLQNLPFVEATIQETLSHESQCPSHISCH